MLSLLVDIFSNYAAQVPLYHLLVEGLLAVWIVWLIFHKSYRPSEVQTLTEKEKDELIAEWQPEPLVPDTPGDHFSLHPQYIEGKVGHMITLNGRQCLNLATLNFLGLVGDERIESAAIKALHKYGVGCCGPRGFYGTVDVHLELEKRLAEFMRCEEAVLYSYGFAAVASAIPAYAKRGDVVFCDNAVNFAIQRGLLASRSRVEFFEHNNMEDLERLLQAQAQKDRQNPKKANVTRRFMVVEGIYLNTGSICPLPKLLELKWKYKVRIFIDESLSFGVLGKTGRGVTEHFGVKMEDVDMVCASLENAVASTGGFCCGRSFVVDHQRLSGLGYCFSASLPPLLAVAASEALSIMETETDRFVKLRENSELMLAGLKKLMPLVTFGVVGSPVFHLKVKNPELQSRDPGTLLDQIVKMMGERGFALTRARYLANEELFPKDPSIRVAVSTELTPEEIEKFLTVLSDVVEEVF